MTHRSSSSVATILASTAPLPVAVQRQLVNGTPELRLALAANPHLDRDVWFEMYRPGVSAAVAERLCWRASFDDAQVAHVLRTCGERRKAPLAALLATADAGALSRHLPVLATGRLTMQTANMLLTKYGVPLDVQLNAASYASFKVSGLWVLRDHSRLTDDQIEQALLGVGDRIGWERWPVLIGMLQDRPGAAARLARRCVGFSVLIWALAYAGVPADASMEFCRQVLDETPRGRGKVAVSTRQLALRQVWTHPATPIETREWLLGQAARNNIVAAVVRHHSFEAWGTGPEQVQDRSRIEALLNVTVSTTEFKSWLWQLTALARNPHLTVGDRTRLVELLGTKAAKEVLSNCAEPALSLARTGTGRLVPPTRWRMNCTAGSQSAITKRLDHPSGTHRAAPCGYDVLGSTRLGWISRTDNVYDKLLIGQWLAERYTTAGAPDEVWELTFSLADALASQSGATLTDLADAVLALMR